MLESHAWRSGIRNREIERDTEIDRERERERESGMPQAQNVYLERER